MQLAISSERVSDLQLLDSVHQILYSLQSAALVKHFPAKTSVQVDINFTAYKIILKMYRYIITTILHLKVVQHVHVQCV